MVVKINNAFKIIFIPFFCIFIYMSKDLIISSNVEWYGKVYAIILDLIIVCLIFLAFTKRITLNKNGLGVTWSIGVYPLKIECKNYYIYWNNIISIYNQFPHWFPYSMISIIGKRNGKRAHQVIGSAYTNKKETLLFLAQHVHKDVFDSSTWKLVQKYKKQLDKKNIYTYMK